MQWLNKITQSTPFPQAVKKAIFPVAGLGSRFLPATKASPKEMLPIVDKPLIQYAVEEAVRAGLNHMIFITSASKRSIEDHFDNHFELESRLKERMKDHLLSIVRNVSPPGVQFTYVRQNQPLGLGHAILCAEQVVGNEPFAVLLADDLIDDHKAPCLSDMLAHYYEHQASLIAVQPVPWQDIQQYGAVCVGEKTGLCSTILSMQEKPSQATAASNLAAVGRYVFTPSIFASLKKVVADSYGEIQLTDAICDLLATQTVQAYHFRGKRYDCGSKLGYLKATIAFGLQHAEIKDGLSKYLNTLYENTISEVL